MGESKKSTAQSSHSPTHLQSTILTMPPSCEPHACDNSANCSYSKSLIDQYYYYYFINVLANYIQCTQLLVKENLALNKSTGQKVHTLLQ